MHRSLSLPGASGLVLHLPNLTAGSVHGFQSLHSSRFSAFFFKYPYVPSFFSSFLYVRLISSFSIFVLGFPRGFLPFILPSKTSFNMPSPLNTCQLFFCESFPSA